VLTDIHYLTRVLNPETNWQHWNRCWCVSWVWYGQEWV